MIYGSSQIEVAAGYFGQPISAIERVVPPSAVHIAHKYRTNLQFGISLTATDPEF